ncbi:MAG: DNA-directed RNA polymerase subunit H [Candidatus Aenigmatarchaeota archaeon]|nr:MAG: DNA-directed RNA polymerase subunit H [Candidatus Aenigmarchaeota archaeon]
MNILEHTLAPEFRVLSEEEKKEVLEKFNITEDRLPKILDSDPVVKKIGAKPGNMLEIKRTSEVARESVYYRIVVES